MIKRRLKNIDDRRMDVIELGGQYTRIDGAYTYDYIRPGNSSDSFFKEKYMKIFFFL